MCSIPQVDWVFYPAVKTAGELARALASSARIIEQAIPKIYNCEGENGYLHKLLASFQQELLPTLKLQSDNEKDYNFADIYAQTIAYSLFTARVFSHVKDKRSGSFTHFDRETAWQQLLETNPFFRKLFEDISEQPNEALGDELIGAINDIFGILQAAKMDAILSDFQLKMNREDIVIRFYEDFLAAYKPQIRERRGVYYTPEPVVSYMVRSVDNILKSDFGLADGLADATKVRVANTQGTTETHKVLITDVATGTGTFLHSVIGHIYQSLKLNPNEWSNYVSQHLLPRLLGFELLMAPYAVAHMKLGLQLAELGYKFDTEERLRVYLTNTLQEAFQIPPADNLDTWIRDEADAANKIKQEAPVMVVLGNPPYSGHSANKGVWISNLLKGIDTITNQRTSSYFEVDGKPLGEKNPKWLNDDYVKFIRFAQWRIEQTGYGILAFITNHGYLDNSTFRGMRQSLMQTFDDIYVLDLHGNTKKKEQSPDGTKDENVFDIQQGVAISIFVKRQNGNKEEKNVYHASLYGLRDRKYQWLKQNDLTTTPWSKLKPQSPFYLFVPQNTNLLAEYDMGWKVTDIFPVNSVGIVTARDELSIHWNRTKVWKTVTDFAKLPIEVARLQYQLNKDARDWKIELAQKDLRNHPSLAIQKTGPFQELISPILYRPFDVRYTYYTGKSRGFHCRPRGEVMRHMLAEENLGLIARRQMIGELMSYFFVSKYIIADGVIRSDNKGGESIFPLYLHPNSNHPKELEEPIRPNLSQDFLKAIASKLGYTPIPEAIFYYIYAILHSPTYRTRYAEFLKIDFPRVPLTSDRKLFSKLSALGEKLADLHLVRSPTLDNRITNFVENKGNRIVDPGHPKYNDCAVIINKKGDKFTDVPKEVWEFYVGGYQVCQKWLKDRKGRTLSDEDIQHYQRIVVALQETISLMEQIDSAIPSFPIQ